MLNYFEINEAKKYFEKFIKSPRQRAVSAEVLIEEAETEQVKPEQVYIVKEEKSIDLTGLTYKEDRLTEILKKTCLRAGFKLGLITDSAGLPLAYHNVNDPELLSAVSSIIIEMRDKFNRLFPNYSLDYITFEINSFDKLVVKQFEVKGSNYTVIYIMPQSVLEKEEIIISTKMLEKEIGS
ncbi:MAG: hypothetical protein N2999_03750 [Proteobacteria bacterium]|nr:hypothetical protein [Pseudomonadota bacterium]